MDQEKTTPTYSSANTPTTSNQNSPRTVSSGTTIAVKDEANKDAAVAPSNRRNGSVMERIQAMEMNKNVQIIRPKDEYSQLHRHHHHTIPPGSSPRSHNRHISAPMSTLQRSSSAASAVPTHNNRRGTAPPLANGATFIPSMGKLQRSQTVLASMMDQSLQESDRPTSKPSSRSTSIDSADPSQVPNHALPICCARHSMFQFPSTLPPPPEFTNCAKLVVAPNKPNILPPCLRHIGAPMASPLIPSKNSNSSPKSSPKSSPRGSPRESPRASPRGSPNSTERSIQGSPESPSIHQWLAEAHQAVSAEKPPDSTRHSLLNSPASFSYSPSPPPPSTPSYAYLSTLPNTTNAHKLSVVVGSSTPTPPPATRTLGSSLASGEVGSNFSPFRTSLTPPILPLSSHSPVMIASSPAVTPPIAVNVPSPVPTHGHSASYHIQTAQTPPHQGRSQSHQLLSPRVDTLSLTATPSPNLSSASPVKERRLSSSYKPPATGPIDIKPQTTSTINQPAISELVSTPAPTSTIRMHLSSPDATSLDAPPPLPNYPQSPSSAPPPLPSFIPRDRAASLPVMIHPVPSTSPPSSTTTSSPSYHRLEEEATTAAPPPIPPFRRATSGAAAFSGSKSRSLPNPLPSPSPPPPSASLSDASPRPHPFDRPLPPIPVTNLQPPPLISTAPLSTAPSITTPLLVTSSSTVSTTSSVTPTESTTSTLTLQDQLASLTREMSDAVQSQEFERCIDIRDKMKLVQAELNKSVPPQ